VDIVIASVEDEGDCWARQEEILFTVSVVSTRDPVSESLTRTEHDTVARLCRAQFERLDEEWCG
jgi:hypothetical protein